MISHISTSEAVTRVGDYIFRICFTDSFQGKGLAQFALETLAAQTAVVLVDVSRVYSKGLGKCFAEAFEKGGGKVVWRGEYEAASLDADALLQEVALHPSDVLFVPGGYADSGALLGSAGRYGIKSEFLVGDGIGARVHEFIGAAADGIYFSAHWSRWVDTLQSRRFVDSYKRRNGIIPSDSVALVYDCFMVLKEAFERAKTLDSGRVRDALASTPGFLGVTGLIRFNEHGDPIKPLVINQFKFGGILYVGSTRP